MFSAQIPVASLRKRAKKHNKIRMNFAKPYEDLREFIAALDANDKLYRIHREINKDTELQPLVRWQFRGGMPEEERRGFLFDNVTDEWKEFCDNELSFVVPDSLDLIANPAAAAAQSAAS